MSLLVAALATALGAMAGVMLSRRARPVAAIEPVPGRKRKPSDDQESPMKIRVRDIVSYLGQDFVVEAILTYTLNGKAYRLVRAVDGKDVRWIEPLHDDSDDRLLVFAEVSDLEMSTPPPQTISYGQNTYLPRLTGKALVEIAGKTPDRSAGPCQVWRYRAAGDLYLQIEDWSGRVVVLAGESVHKGMIEILPGAIGRPRGRR